MYNVWSEKTKALMQYGRIFNATLIQVPRLDESSDYLPKPNSSGCDWPPILCINVGWPATPAYYE